MTKKCWHCGSRFKVGTRDSTYHHSGSCVIVGKEEQENDTH